MRENELMHEWKVSVESIKHTSDLIQSTVKNSGSGTNFLAELYDRLIDQQAKAMEISNEHEKLTGKSLM